MRNGFLVSAIAVLLAVTASGCRDRLTPAGPGGAAGAVVDESAKGQESAMPLERIVKTPDEWKKILTPEQYDVTRDGGTERAFSHEYYGLKADGAYRCACCGLELFDSKAKFESGTGWPSFYEPVNPAHVAENEDRNLLSSRTEVLCARCDAHLGHVFHDGPPPTGLRYCINGAALKFTPRE